MEISAIIAINLKRIREERKLSMGQLAEMAGVSKVVLSQLEKGTANPTINTIWKITGARGCRTRASSRCRRPMPST